MDKVGNYGLSLIHISAVFGNPDYQMNSSSVQKQLKAAGIDTNSKKYKAVLSEMMKNGDVYKRQNRVSPFDIRQSELMKCFLRVSIS